MADCYATVASAPPTHFSGDPSVHDWAVISYVHTESAVASGGMPDWVCADVDTVLDALVLTRRLGKRAVWFDLLAMHALPLRWPAVSTLHALSSPLIAVPPTRTLEYSRYQIPDRWDPETSDFYTRLELLFRQCPKCSTKVPLEYDSRLLNIAATLRAWPVNEVMIASASRGAFISFATLDRFHYTLSWYVLLLQVAMRIARSCASTIGRVTHMYGPPLFEICYDCLSFASDVFADDNIRCHIDTLDETLGTLLGHVSRLCLPFTCSRSEGVNLWSLPGWVKSPGDIEQMPSDNSSRLGAITGQMLNQARYEQIAANIIRGPGAQAPCFRHGDKWMCALILSNISDFLRVFQRGAALFDSELRNAFSRILFSDNAFGDLFFEDNTLDVGFMSEGSGISCLRSPVCAGHAGSVCFFNELSGILCPESVGQFLLSCGFPKSNFTKLLHENNDVLFRRLEMNGSVFHGFEYHGSGLPENGACVCCRYQDGHSEHTYKTVMILAWRARVPAREIDDFESLPHTSIFSYVVVDVEESGHVVLRGVFNMNLFTTCPVCLKAYVRGSVVTPCLTKTEDILEIHVSNPLPLLTALPTVTEIFNDSHDRQVIR